MNHRMLLVTVMVVIIVLTVSFSQTVSAAPLFISKPGDENWDAVIGATGMNNYVSSLAVYQGKLYAGGGFSSPASYIAQWDGMSWTGVDGGMNMPVYALISDGTYLYAGGGFTNAGSCTDGSCGRIARWNGTAWSSVGGGFYDGEVLALAIDGMGHLYAGGTFNGNVAVWNGTVWGSLDSGPGGWVYALAVDSSGNLYAGGDFNTNNGGVANYLAVWDGSSWAAVDEFDAIDNQVYRLLMDGEGNLVVGGALFFTKGKMGRPATRRRARSRRRVAPLRRRIEELLQRGAACRHRKAAGMCREQLKLFEAMWTFVRVEGVEPTNNFAERLLRMAVLWRKRSFGTHSPEGSRFVERILTTQATLKLQDRNVVDYLMDATAAARLGHPVPSLLPAAA
jgi:hypothetical protein